MAKRSFALSSWTPVAVADTTNFTDNGYQALQGGSSTQVTYISEVYMGGLATASAPTYMTLSRDTTVGATLTALTTGQSDAPLNAATAALAAPVNPFTASTTKPQRSATAHLLQLGINAFGSIVRWVAYPGEEIGMTGNTQPLGEVSLSAYTGGTPGLMNSHIIYETF